MRPFREGDKVRCLEDYNHQFTKGKVYTVRRDQYYDSVQIETDDLGSYTNGWAASKFELVEESSIGTETKLEELVRKANEGEQAVKDIIMYYPGEVLATYDDDMPGNSTLGNNWRTVVTFSVKQGPSFEPFYVGPHHVHFEYPYIHIGCCQFLPKELEAHLNDMLKGGLGVRYIGDLMAQPTRFGVSTPKGALSWEHCEQIVKALKAAKFK